jgi:hypothetical protein
MLRQRKAPKRKASRRLARCAGTLRVSAKPALAQLAISLALDDARTGGSLAPVFPAMLGCAYGVRMMRPVP